MKLRRALALLVVILSSAVSATAQIISVTTVDGKQVTCMHSGLMSGLANCGVPPWYQLAFIGTISSISPIQNDEKQLTVIPEEIFHGSPASPLIVLTSQAACLPKLAVGDRWLFFLREVKDKPIVLDFYGNASRPAADAQEQIRTLRRLKDTGGLSILRGRVTKNAFFDDNAVAGAHVVALHVTDKLKFEATTAANGRYEFQLLSPGNYKISVDPIGSFRADDSQVDLQPNACWDLTLSRSPHAMLGGHIRHLDGSPVPKVGVVLINADSPGYITTQTDAKGHFQFGSLGQGKYVVGINYPARDDWFNGAGSGPAVKFPPASTFYSGASERSAAIVIGLSTDETLDNVDFHLPQ